LLQSDGQVAKAYRVELTPSAVVVSPDGTVASSLSTEPEAIRRLVERTIDGTLLALRMEGHSHGPGLHLPAALKVGEPAPPLRLPSLGGTTLDLEEFQGQSIFLLFWTPDCPLCGNMLSELKAREARAADDTPVLFLVMTGSVDTSHVTGLRTPIVFDDGFVAARSFGVFGTPSALLVGPDGRIASELVVGTAQVLTLLQAN
jgi:peroxiredoxin